VKLRETSVTINNKKQISIYHTRGKPEIFLFCLKKMILQNLYSVRMPSKGMLPKNVGKKSNTDLWQAVKVITYYILCLDFVMFVVFVSFFNL